MFMLRSTCLCLDLCLFGPCVVPMFRSICLCALCHVCCNIPHYFKKKKKRGKGSDCFWFPRAPHLTPLPTTHFHPPLFSLLAGSLFSFFHFLSLLFTYTHTHTHFHTHPLASTPNHTISPSFFWQDHQKNT